MAGIQKTFINFLWTRWCKMDVISIRLKEIEGLGYFSKILHENRSEFIRGLLEEGRKMKAVKLYKEKKTTRGLRIKKMIFRRKSDWILRLNSADITKRR